MFFRIIALAACVAAIGCSKTSPDIAQVDGVLTIKGKPGDKVYIQFVPDAEKGFKGPMSSADTDAQGRFTLRLQAKNIADAKPGALVGEHRVVLSDLRLAESATGQGVPIRFGREYTIPGSTPLRQEVNPGEQTIELTLP